MLRWSRYLTISSAGGFEVAEIDQETDVIQLLAACVDLDLVVMAVQVLALPLYPRSWCADEKLRSIITS